MQTDAVSSGSSAKVNGAVSYAGQSMDRNAFLKLLVAQMQNQDPLKPMEDKEFLAQLAQFSSLEQMQNLNESLGTFAKGQTAVSSLALIGRDVKWTDADSGGVYSGKVSTVHFDNGAPMLTIPSVMKDDKPVLDKNGQVIHTDISIGNVLSVS